MIENRMENHINKKKFAFTKKNIIILSVIALLVISGTTWGILSHHTNRKTSSTPKVINQQATIQDSKISSSLYKKMLGIKYQLLYVKSLEDAGKGNTLFLDIQVDKALSEDQLLALGKEAHDVLKKELGDKGTVSAVNLNVFTTKEAFLETQKKDYSGQYVDGLIQTFSSTHFNGNKATVTTYETYKMKTDVTQMDASLDFEIKDAHVSNDKKSIDLEVVMSDGTASQVQDTIQSLVDMTKSANEGSEQVNLNTYANQKSYEDKKPYYVYSTSTPNLLLKQMIVTY